MDDERIFSLSDLIENHANLLNIYINGFSESVELRAVVSWDYKIYYEGNDANYNIFIGDNGETYDDFINYGAENLEENIVGLGVLNPILFLNLIDNDETIKKLLKFEKVVFNCGLEVKPIIY